MVKRCMLSIAFLIVSTLFSSIAEQHHQKLTPSTTVLVWDFHDVLAKRNRFAMARQVLSIIRRDIKLVSLFFWPPFWKELYNAQHTCSTLDELLAKVIEHYPLLKPHETELEKLVNLYDLVPSSVELLSYLQKQGYHNYLASNMGLQSYTIQRERFPNVFALFDGHYIPAHKNNHTGLTIAKPCTEYYIELRDYLHQHNIVTHKAIIFIDDKQKNIDGALASNHKERNQIYGITFISAEKLKQDLALLIEIEK